MIKIKRTLQPFIKDDEIVFGFGNSSIERRIKNTEENIELIRQLDADYSLRENFLLNREKLEEFRNLGLLTENNYDNSKFSRNINFYEWIDITQNTDPRVHQEKLKGSTVLIVGLGGIGGTVAEILARLGVGKFILVDFDIVEESNLTRQSVFSNSDVGEYKNKIVKEYLEKISESEIVSVNCKINSKNELEDIFKKYDFDIAICCADTPFVEIDYWFSDLSFQYNRPFIAGSYASTTINYAYINPKRTMSLREFYGGNMITDDSILDKKAPSSIIAPISFMASGMIAYKVFSELTGLGNIKDVIQIDLLTWEVHNFEITKNIS
jgi:thiF family protein|nr:MAG TPA: ThiF family [Caudoviricetes sp.]